MNIELRYSEAVTIKAALDNTIKDSHELLLDTDFEKKYPNCYMLVQNECERAVALRDRIQAELDKIQLSLNQIAFLDSPNILILLR